MTRDAIPDYCTNARNIFQQPFLKSCNPIHISALSHNPGRSTVQCSTNPSGRFRVEKKATSRLFKSTDVDVAFPCTICSNLFALLQMCLAVMIGYHRHTRHHSAAINSSMAGIALTTCTILRHDPRLPMLPDILTMSLLKISGWGICTKRTVDRTLPAP